MFSRWYKQWMYDWETRLTSVDNNRVVRPMEWGAEWLGGWTAIGDAAASADSENILRATSEHIIATSDAFFAAPTPTDFTLEHRAVQVYSTRQVPDPKLEAQVQGQTADFLRFTSSVITPHWENNRVNARWFPAPAAVPRKRAVIVLPHWNADGIAYNGLCSLLNKLGIAALRLSLPYHDARMPPEISRADYAVSANIGRTITAARQGVCDVRSCVDWLEAQGYSEFGILGTSLGSAVAFLAAAHEPRLRAVAFNHASSYFADVVWRGQSTRHIREGLEPVITLDRLRPLWMCISPMAYFDHYARFPQRRSLTLYARYDLTFPPDLSQQVVAEFAVRGVNSKTVVLPCGHYTTGESPFKYLDGWHLVTFLRNAFRELAA